MKYFFIFPLFIASMSGIGGCGQREETAAGDVDGGNAGDDEPKREVRSEQKRHEQAGHHHHHAFRNPAENAKQWNDPERDKWQHPEEIVAALALKPGSTVADIGAGTGYMVAPMSKEVGTAGTVLAIDASAAMVEYLEKRSAELGPAKIVARKVSSDDPELPTAGVDGVLMLDTWHGI